jgi:hypothetical protein
VNPALPPLRPDSFLVEPHGNATVGHALRAELAQTRDELLLAASPYAGDATMRARMAWKLKGIAVATHRSTPAKLQKNPPMNLPSIGKT